MNTTKDYENDINCVINGMPEIFWLKGKKILCTGATGMIVSAVVEILLYLNRKFAAGITVYIAGRSEPTVRERFKPFCLDTDYKFVSYDATKSTEFQVDVDYIIHGASNANPAAYVKEPVETILGNVIGINSLLNTAATNKTTRLLYISSSEVYGNKDDNVPFEESDYGYIDILKSRACYPNAKRLAETLCVSYSAEYGIDTVIVRPGHIYGPTITTTDTRASAQFTRNALKGEDIVMKSSGLQLRSYCYTMDCASAILYVLLKGEKNTAYNISNKKSVVTIRDIAMKFAQYGNSRVVFENPSDAEKNGYNMMTNSSLNSNRLEALGWNALFDLDAGVSRTLKYMK